MPDPDTTDTSAAESREFAIDAIRSLWWATLIRGLLLVVLGIYILFRPGMSALFLTKVIGVFVIFEGTLLILAGILVDVPSRGSVLLRGAIAILLGIFIFVYSAIVAKVAVMTILYIIAAVAVLNGILEIMAAVRGRKEIEGEGWMILGGVVWVLFGILLFLAPISFGIFVIRVIGSFAILAGISLIALAFKTRSFGKELAAS